MDIKNKIKSYQDELIALRRQFHQSPELGLQEYQTASFIFEYLESLGLEVRKCLETGVVAVLKGKYPGKTLMLRCDIDALEVVEETNLPFKSQNNGVMHACGHDGHAAIMLIVAKILTEYRDKFSGQIKFVFQPNEEDAAAQLMIDEGVLEDPRPDAVFGLHLWSYHKTGEIGIVSGPIMASSYYFRIKLTGLQGHGGAPHKAINPIDVSSHIINAINSLQSFAYDPQKPTVISFGKIMAGTKPTIIPATLEMEGSIRCLHNEDEQVRNDFVELVKAIAHSYKVKCEVELKCGNSLLNNDKEMSSLVKEIASDVVGLKNVITENVSVMLGDDFAEFLRDIRGVYYFVGIANEAKNTTYEHHHPKFDLDEDALSIAVEMQLKLTLKYLEDK
ncbi:amidohydrolase [Erysipelotrichaceae bacterium OttesenSCG-928-M19]|nr:amidohydrolase [Erysipelotrichaceae bacterium OttesenSCG-928-M19]